MYYNKRKLAVSIMWIIIGGILFGLEITGIVDNPIWSGLGGAWIGIGIMQIIRNVKYNSNPEYKEKIDIAYKDERNGYIRMKAWSWAGYLFIIGAAPVSVILMLTKHTEIGQTISYCMCTVLALYWISYMVLQKKY